MSLTLIAVSLDDQPLSQPVSARFDARGGTIGRADHNTMALPDPQRHVSRQQAEIVAQGSQYLIRNIGAANPITVAGRVLNPGEVVPLHDRDTLHIGGYELQVQWAMSDATTPLPGQPARAPAARAPAPAPAHDPFADIMASAPASGFDAFAGLMGTAPAGVDPRSAALSPAGPAAAAPRLPDDFDPFAAPPAPAPRPASVADPFADLMAQSGPTSIDAAFGLSPRTGGDPLADFMAGLSPSSRGAVVTAGPRGLSTDPLALFGATAVAEPVPAEPRPAPRTAPAPVREPPVLPSPLPPPVLAAVRSPAPTAAPTGPPDAQALWAQFCQGAGVDVPLPPGGLSEGLRQLGQILHSAVGGTLQLMAVRASTKQELRAAVTVIQQHENNPLKFSPDARAALEHLLTPPLRGFLAGPAAMDDAMQDLVGHAIGTVVGMRAAIEGMLDRFGPAALESKLVGSSMLDSVLPMNRRARLWDLYLKHHQSIREEAQEDFHALFGKAFLAAYEDQVERLKHKPAPPR